MKNTLLIWLLGFLPAMAFADWTEIEAKEFKVPAPPKSGSAAEKEEYQVLHDFESTRTEADCNEANEQDEPSFEVFFGPKAKILTKAEYKKVKDIVSEAMELTERITQYWKVTYKRPRPYKSDKTLTPCLEDLPKTNKSYPSGHASLSALAGCLLAEKYPAKADEIRARAQRIAELRLISGVHHPSDIASGQKLGEQVCKRLLSEDDFEL